MTELKAAQRRTWASGDYAKIAGAMPLMGELLCEDIDLRGGERVLDVATGSGNTALSAARRHCVVTGIDYVPALVERARVRAAAEQLTVTFQVGDAEELPFADGAFDVVLSTIGVMFAPDQRQAADELVRVCRPGGRLGLTNWTAGGFAGQVFELYARYVPPPKDLPSPMVWGEEAGLAELLGDHVREVRASTLDQVFRYPSVASYVEGFRAYFGPTITTFGGLPPEGQERLAAELTELVSSFNTATDGTLVLPAEYLRYRAVRR
ncbi:methyltransferase domain-containing protein [Saccharomonospora sp. NPDC046836]|uniref:class I SAM-dependent methyltransferase n=1 Tax=Saccharomonospora sp. NPDC046836 TaxID=3156921 RepID=UPI0033D1614C